MERRIILMYGEYTLEEALASVGKGWAPLIERLFAAKPANVKVQQVKEKFGTLRFYTSPNPIGYENFIIGVERESATICEWCGKPGTIDNRYFWLLTLCTSCKRKRKRQKDAKII